MSLKHKLVLHPNCLEKLLTYMFGKSEVIIYLPTGVESYLFLVLFLLIVEHAQKNVIDYYFGRFVIIVIFHIKLYWIQFKHYSN